MSKVTNKHNLYTKRESQYQLIYNCLEGQDALKENAQEYLTSSVDERIFKEYVKRAIYYNVPKSTLSGVTGLAFLKPIKIELPEQISSMLKNVDGAGLSLDQQSRKTLEEVLSVSRCGLLADFPSLTQFDSEGQEISKPITLSDIESQGIKPKIVSYNALSIINWGSINENGNHKLSLVVLRESYKLNEADEFDVKTGTQYRVLRLKDGLYEQEIYRKSQAEKTGIESDDYVSHSVIYPLNGKGQRMNFIPFKFVGSTNNDDKPDIPVMTDLCNLSIGHFRNSADYENSAWVVGQPTLIVKGLTPDWKEKYIKDIRMGSTAYIPMPAGGDVTILQANPNTMSLEGMHRKEKQMLSLGAKLIQESSSKITATQAKIENASSNSVITQAIGNVNDAYNEALKWCFEFMTDSELDEESLIFEISKDVSLDNLTISDLQNVFLAYEGNGITFNELRDVLRELGIATEDDEEVKDIIELEQSERLEVEA